MGVMLRIVLLSAAVLGAEGPEIGVRVEWPVVSPYIVNQYKPADCFGHPPCSQDESAGRRATFGLVARVPLHARVAVRFMPGWQRISFDLSAFDGVSSYALSTTANRWELPVVAEWRIASHLRPAVGGVVSVVSSERTLSRLDVVPGFGSRDGYTNLFRIDALSRRAVGGLVADIEFPLRGRFASFAPSVRYTRWFSKHFGNRGRLDGLSVGTSLRFGRRGRP